MFNFLKSKLTTAALGIGIVLLGLTTLKIYHQKKDVAKSVKDLESKAGEVKENNDYLSRLSAYFKSNAYLEKEARAKFNYKKADEEVAFVYKDTTKKNNDQRLTTESNIQSLPFWKRWLYYLAGWKFGN